MRTQLDALPLMRPALLSESEFGTDWSRSTRLFHKKEGRPSPKDKDAYLRLFADGGKQGTVTLFEATFIANGSLVRRDILRISERTIELIEVESKSWNSDDLKCRLGAAAMVIIWRYWLNVASSMVRGERTAS